uniref:Uncharacterized protein n=1 Tax=Physcomitrium patens TaxID=3218 RepID=A0A2K1KMQ9_PHYPA|nr:hypothetical protein PHYPA_005956 [Physcomitrium patens]
MPLGSGGGSCRDQIPQVRVVNILYGVLDSDHEATAFAGGVHDSVVSPMDSTICRLDRRCLFGGIRAHRYLQLLLNQLGAQVHFGHVSIVIQ